MCTGKGWRGCDSIVKDLIPSFFLGLERTGAGGLLFRFALVHTTTLELNYMQAQVETTCGWDKPDWCYGFQRHRMISKAR